MDRGELWVWGGGGTLMVLVVALVIWASIADQDRWEKFSATHNCQRVGTVQATTATGVSGDGKVAVVTVPEQHVYKCDDGQTYTNEY